MALFLPFLNRLPDEIDIVEVEGGGDMGDDRRYRGANSLKMTMRKQAYRKETKGFTERRM